MKLKFMIEFQKLSCSILCLHDNIFTDKSGFDIKIE